jgi:hypothetical protein
MASIIKPKPGKGKKPKTDEAKSRGGKELPPVRGKKSNDGDARKRLKEYEKAYAKLKGAAKPMKIDVKMKNTLSALLKAKPAQPNRRGGR